MWAFLVGRMDGNLYLDTWTGYVSTTEQDLKDGGWHHVAAVYDQNQYNIAFYIDGSLVSTASTPINTVLVYNLTIGQGLEGYDSFDGKLDDVRIYDQALTTAEIAALAAMGN